ncbi:MAG: N-carbamoylputrescine amidase [Ilumatobacteraceae bacterium]|nr:N-carbamoylputrescine amidase [Ilumatobacteraceae bacterium]
MTLTVASIQMSMTDVINDNVAIAEGLVRQAAERGAQIVVIPELFEGLYFCKDRSPDHFSRAREIASHPTVAHFQKLAAELRVVLPISVFERQNNAYFNTVVVVDATGDALGIYRKSHIPDGPGYSEKYYFSPGDTGFQVWNTVYGRVGVGICWDQWFPEAARVMALHGAEVLLYPTAIGSEPQNPAWDSSAHWQRVMQGHAAANLLPVVAANRYGHEVGQSCNITFYGSSFIADNTGEKVAEAGRDCDAVLVASFDRQEMQSLRASWGLFRDRRPNLYGSVTSLDGTIPS